MRLSDALALGLGLLSAGIYPLHASVTAGSPLTGEATSDFPAVGRLGTTSSLNGSATAVFDGQFALTARHLLTSAGGITGELRPPADLRFWLSGTEYAVAEV